MYEGGVNLYKFVPVAVETLGPGGDEALDLVKDLGKRMVESTGELRSRTYLTQRISIAIQRGNAANIFATIPSSNKIQEIYYYTNIILLVLSIILFINYRTTKLL
jgi:hypothetical protein